MRFAVLVQCGACCGCFDEIQRRQPSLFIAGRNMLESAVP